MNDKKLVMKYRVFYDVTEGSKTTLTTLAENFDEAKKKIVQSDRTAYLVPDVGTFLPCEECKKGATPYERSLPHFNIKDEVLKLKLILDNPPSQTPTMSGPAGYDDAFIGRGYVAEKLDNILEGAPITLDPYLRNKFNALKQEPKD